MKITRKIVEIDEEKCDGCGQCVIGCAEGALTLVDGKVMVISENLCDGLGACIGECPQGALQIIEKQAEAFDEAAVEAHLESVAAGEQSQAPTMPCGCPSTRIQSFAPGPAAPAKSPSGHGTPASALSHWPVQIRLIPPNAPFLKGADLLILADCVPVAFPGLHQELLRDKAVMIGCPKFDKFAAIFKTARHQKHHHRGHGGALLLRSARHGAQGVGSGRRPDSHEPDGGQHPGGNPGSAVLTESNSPRSINLAAFVRNKFRE